MVNYQEGKIYKIISNSDDDICYVGSTTKKFLSQRMAEHKNRYKCWKNGKHIKITVFELFEKYGIENCRIELLEIFPSNSKDELTKKEGEHIKLLNCVNKRIEGRTLQEHLEQKKIYNHKNANKISEQKKKYKQENKDVILEKNKKYYEENKDTILEKQKIYYDENRDKKLEYAKKYCDENKNILSKKKKKYREENKVKIAEYQKLYREKNKEKYTCSCGSNIRKLDKSTHEKSKKHIDFITSQVIV